MTINTGSSIPKISLNNEETLCHYATNQPLNDIIQTIFFQCQSKGEWESIGALACVSKHYNRCATAYWKQFDLKLFCPGLTILDAKTQGITIDDEPEINKLAILKCYEELASKVENNEGLTLLTMAKGLTLNQLVEIAAKEGMILEFTSDQILLDLSDVPIEQTDVILITNSVFKTSRMKTHAQLEECVVGHGYKLPTVLEYVALCVLTSKVFKKCLYSYNPWTFGCSSTYIGGYPLVVGGSAPTCLSIRENDSIFMHYGAGGKL